MLARLSDHGTKMNKQMLYRVRRKDIMPASKVLADAFQHDPLWNRIREGEPDFDKRFRAIFEVPVRHCLKYGEVYATSEGLEGVIGWVPGEYADTNAWRMILSGSLGSAIRIGLNAVRKMRPVFSQVVKDRRKHMAGHTFLYVSVLGVATTLQGKGFGKRLLAAAIEECERKGLYLYLETETEENARMYEHFGFSLLKKITLPQVDLPMWEMAREPGA